MPIKYPCTAPGCPELTDGGPCPKHKRERERARGSAAVRLYDHRWRAAREAFLRENPFCVDCLAAGVHEFATVVDHQDPHKGDLVKFWDRGNWRSRCKPHHDEKTAREDGGFGRPSANQSSRCKPHHDEKTAREDGGFGRPSANQRLEGEGGQNLREARR